MQQRNEKVIVSAGLFTGVYWTFDWRKEDMPGTQKMLRLDLGCPLYTKALYLREAEFGCGISQETGGIGPSKERQVLPPMCPQEGSFCLEISGAPAGNLGQPQGEEKTHK